MKKKYILVAKEFQSLLQSCTEDSVWQLSDKVLYDLCKKYPETVEYGKFYFKCKTCIEIIESKFGRKLTPRQLDRILLEIDANSKKSK